MNQGQRFPPVEEARRGQYPLSRKPEQARRLPSHALIAEWRRPPTAGQPPPLATCMPLARSKPASHGRRGRRNLSKPPEEPRRLERRTGKCSKRSSPKNRIAT